MNVRYRFPFTGKELQAQIDKGRYIDEATGDCTCDACGIVQYADDLVVIEPEHMDGDLKEAAYVCIDCMDQGWR